MAGVSGSALGEERLGSHCSTLFSIQAFCWIHVNNSNLDSGGQMDYPRQGTAAPNGDAQFPPLDGAYPLCIGICLLFYSPTGRMINKTALTQSNVTKDTACGK